MTKMFYKAAAIAAVAAIASLAAPAPAEAGRGGRALAAGVVGFATGAIIAGSIANNRRAAYHDGYYDGHYGPPPRQVYYGPPPPWSPDWYAYCHSKYRSFDPRSGTYQPYHGPRRFCQ